MRHAYSSALRMLNDAHFRARLFSEDADANELEMDPATFALLRELDGHQIQVLSAGSMGKRLLAMDAVIPRTIATLHLHQPTFLETFLAQTLPRQLPQEIQGLLAAIENCHHIPSDDRRFLRDLLSVEAATAQSTAGWKPHVDLHGLHQRSEYAMTAKLEGGLQGTFGPGAASRPASYPNRPGTVLIIPGGDSSLHVHRLEGRLARIWDACAAPCDLTTMATSKDEWNKVAIWIKGGALERVAVTPPRNLS